MLLSITTLLVDNLASGDLGTFNYPLATSIILGDISLGTTVTATLATVFTSGFDGTLGDLSLTTSGVAVVRMSATKIVGTVTLTNSGAGSEGHFSGLTAVNGSLVNPAKTTDLTALATVTGTLNVGGRTVNLPALVTMTATLTASDAYDFSADALVTSAAISTHSTATVSVKSVANTAHFTQAATIENLTAVAQGATIDLGTMAGLKSADITGAGTAATAYTVSANASNTVLTSLDVDGVINTLTITAAPALATLTTAGKITDFTVADTTTMTTINFGHTFISGDTAATVTVSGVTNLASLDMSSLTKVKTIDVQRNAKLATLVAPSSTVLAEPIAAISVTVSANALTGNYNEAVAGTETTSYTMASIESNDLTSLKAFIEAYAAQDGRTATSVSATSGIANITHDIQIDVVTIDGSATTTSTLSAALNGNAAAATGPDAANDTADDTTDSTGGITTANELAIVTTE